MANTKPDYEILVGIKGGGAISGESANKIRSEINEIFNGINSSRGTAKISSIKVTADKLSLLQSITSVINGVNGVSGAQAVALPPLKLKVNTADLQGQITAALEAMPTVKIKVSPDWQSGSGSGGSGGGGTKKTTLDQAIQRSASWRKMILSWQKELYSADLPSARRNEINTAIKYARSQDANDRRAFRKQNDANRAWNAQNPTEPQRRVYTDAELKRLTDIKGTYMKMPDYVRAQAALDVARGVSGDAYTKSRNKVKTGNADLTALLTKLGKLTPQTGSEEEKLVQDTITQIQTVQSNSGALLKQHRARRPRSSEAAKTAIGSFSDQVTEIERVTKLANEAEKKVQAADKQAQAKTTKERGQKLKELVAYRKDVIEAENQLTHLQNDPEANKEAIAKWGAIKSDRDERFKKALEAYEPDATKQQAVIDEINEKHSIQAAAEAGLAKQGADADKSQAKATKEQETAYQKIVNLKNESLSLEKELAKLQQDSVGNADAIQQVKTRKADVDTQLSDAKKAYMQTYKPGAKNFYNQLNAEASRQQAEYNLSKQKAQGTDNQRNEIYQKAVKAREQELRLNKEIQNLSKADVSREKNQLEITQKRQELLEAIAKRNENIELLSGTADQSSSEWQQWRTAIEQEDKVVQAKQNLRDTVSGKQDDQRVADYEKLVKLAADYLSIEKEILSLEATEDSKKDNADYIAQRKSDLQTKRQAMEAQAKAYTTKYGGTEADLKARVVQEEKVLSAVEARDAQKTRNQDKKRVEVYKQLVELAKARVRWESEGAKFADADKGDAATGVGGTKEWQNWWKQGYRFDTKTKTRQNLWGTAFLNKFTNHASLFPGETATSLQGSIDKSKELIALRAKLADKTTKQIQNQELAFIKLQQRAVKLFQDNEDALAGNPEMYKNMQNLVYALFGYDADKKTTMEPMDALNKNFKGNIKDALKQLLVLDAEMERSGVKQLTLGQKITKIFKEKLGYGVMAAAAASARKAISQLYTNVVELDSAMAQLKIVTGESSATLKEYSADAAQAAKETGRTITEIMASSTEYARLGYTLEESLDLSKTTAMLSNVADIDTATATSSMTAILKGFRLEASDAQMVGDMMTKVANEYAIDAGELGAALERGGASLAAANNTLAESMALMAAGNAAIQNAETVGKQHCPAA